MFKHSIDILYSTRLIAHTLCPLLSCLPVFLLFYLLLLFFQFSTLFFSYFFVTCWYDATVFSFSFSLFLLLLLFNNTNDIPLSPIVLFCGLQKKKKKMASRDDRALPLVEPTDLIETTKMRKEEGLPILFVVRGKSFRTEVHRSLFFFLFQI